MPISRVWHFCAHLYATKGNHSYTDTITLNKLIPQPWACPSWELCAPRVASRPRLPPVW